MAEPVEQLPTNFSANDRGGEYLDKLKALFSKQNELISLFNSQTQAGEDAATIKAQIEQLQTDIINEVTQIRDETAAISESGLPSQLNNAHKALTTDGSTFGWAHTNGFNRVASAHFSLIAGDRVLVTASGSDVPATLPENGSPLDPFLIVNDDTSTANVIVTVPFTAPYTIDGDKVTVNAGDGITVPPGQRVFLQFLSATTVRSFP